MMRQMSKKRLWLVISVSISLLIIITFYLGFFNNLELMTIDYRFIGKYLLSGSNFNTDVVLVTVDQASLQQLGDWPWSREKHAKVINNLTAAGAEVIGVDFIFSNGNPKEEAADQELIEATKEAKRIVYPVILDLKISRGWLPFQKDNLKIKEIKLPFKELFKQADNLGYINLILDKDGLVRRIPLITRGKNEYRSFSAVIVREYLQSDKYLDNNLNEGDLINYLGPAKTFPQLSYYQILNNKFAKQLVEDKVVLLGATAIGLGDKYMTPYANFGPMSGVEIHANLIQALIDKNQINKMNSKVTAFIILLTGTLSTYIFIRLKPKIGILILVIEIVLLIFTSFYLFIYNNILLNIVPILVNMLLVYLASLGSHYFLADPKRLQLKEIFNRYLPEELIVEVLNNPAAIKLGGQRREVAILFADIRGFTAYTERHEPEKVVRQVNQYLTVMAESILKNGGMLDKYTGDGIMAVFGAPLEDEEYFIKAIKTALEIQKNSQELESEFDIGIGIGAGEVVAGNIGSQKRMDYTVIGDPVNLAARLEGMAKSGEILITAEDYNKVESDVKGVSLGETKLKGKKRKVEVYNLIDLK